MHLIGPVDGPPAVHNIPHLLMSYRFFTVAAALASASSLIIPARAVSSVAAGPWCGAVTPESIAVNAHLTGAGLQARLAVSTQADFSGPSYSAPVTSAAISGNNVRFDLAGLTPDTPYYYALEVGGVLDTTAGKTGSFRTLPAPGPSSFRFSFASCGYWTESGQYVYQKILAENPRFFIHMGDLHYNDTDETDVVPYRQNIQDAITQSPEMGEMVRKLPTQWIWDDHDFCGNTSDRTSHGRAYARQAYRELIPHYPLPAGGPDAAIYQTFDCGRVRFILTDLRSERERDSDSDTASKSMMGLVQKQWFKNQLTAARDAEVPLIAWMSTVPFLSSSTASDNWGSYKTERKELLEFIRDQDIRNLVIISGDMHALAYDDGTTSATYVAGVRIPVFHAAALTRDGSEKGGPYSGGVSDGPGRFGLMDIADNGSQVSATYTGRIVNSPTSVSTWKTYTYQAVEVKPRPPLGLVAAADLDRIQLKWTDNSTVETGYNVERRSGAGTWSLLGSSPAGQTAFADATATVGTPYEYRVLALNGTALSFPSSTATATLSGAYQAWKLAHFGTTDVSREADDDRDGMDTAEEYLFDCDPLQADRYAWSATRDGSGVVVSFPTSSGRSYRVEAGEGLLDWPVSSPLIAGDGSVKQWTDSSAITIAKRFYRVVVTETPAP